MNRLARNSLIVLDLFLAVTAIVGGVGLLSGVNAPPVEIRGKTPFNSYMIPGLSLLVLVEGSALFAAATLIRLSYKIIGRTRRIRPINTTPTYIVL